MSLKIQNRSESITKTTVDTGGGDYYQTVGYESNIGIDHGDIVRVVDPNQNIKTRVDA